MCRQRSQKEIDTMANLKQIRKHIASVQNTGKITKAMKMVAVSKLRKSQMAVVATRPYVNALVGTIDHIILKANETQHPLLRRPESVKNVALIVVSGDKGLCGAYNHNIVKSARKFVEDRRGRCERIQLYFVGRKAYEATRHIEGVERTLVSGGWDRAASDVALELSKLLCESFEQGEIDEAHILYTVFKSAIQHSVVLDAVLPMQSILTNRDADGNACIDTDKQKEIEETPFVYEPSQREILDALLPRAVMVHIQRSLLEGCASENGARMTAMDNASKNAVEMINRLTLQFNRVRQSAITTELIEVVSGAEAL